MGRSTARALRPDPTPNTPRKLVVGMADAHAFFTCQLKLQTKDIKFDSQDAFVEETVEQLMSVFRIGRKSSFFSATVDAFWKKSQKWVALLIKSKKKAKPETSPNNSQPPKRQKANQQMTSRDDEKAPVPRSNAASVHQPEHDKYPDVWRIDRMLPAYNGCPINAQTGTRGGCETIYYKRKGSAYGKPMWEQICNSGEKMPNTLKWSRSMTSGCCGGSTKEAWVIIKHSRSRPGYGWRITLPEEIPQYLPQNKTVQVGGFPQNKYNGAYKLTASTTEEAEWKARYDSRKRSPTVYRHHDSDDLDN